MFDIYLNISISNITILFLLSIIYAKPKILKNTHLKLERQSHATSPNFQNRFYRYCLNWYLFFIQLPFCIILKYYSAQTNSSSKKSVKIFIKN